MSERDKQCLQKLFLNIAKPQERSEALLHYYINVGEEKVKLTFITILCFIIAEKYV